MEKVRLHFIETAVEDMFTRDTFAIEGEEPTVGEFTYVHDAEEYLLPEGYTVGYTKFDEKGIFDPEDMYCDIFAQGKTPVIVSAQGIKYLKKAHPTE